MHNRWIWFRADSFTNNLLIYANSHDLFSGHGRTNALVQLSLNCTHTYNFHKTCKYHCTSTNLVWNIFYFVVSTYFICMLFKQGKVNEKESKREKSHVTVMALPSFRRVAMTCFWTTLLTGGTVYEPVFKRQRYIFSFWNFMRQFRGRVTFGWVEV